MELALVLAVVAIVFIVRSLKIVPQQNAWVVERLGKFDRTLTPGLSFLVPFVDRVAYKHSLKEVPLDVLSQHCSSKRKRRQPDTDMHISRQREAAVLYKRSIES